MLVSIPPKYAVSDVVGYVKGKTAIYIARNSVCRRRNFGGEKFWARGYYVSTVGEDEDNDSQNRPLRVLGKVGV